MTGSAQGQEEAVKKGDWQKVMALPPGTRVHVLRIDLKEISGRVETVSAGTIGISSKSSLVSVARTDVRRVSTRRPMSRRVKHAVVGSVIGAGAGMPIGVGAGAALGSGFSPQAMALGLLIGAAVGVPLGLLAAAEETVFERRMKP
jgi:hypothetical protein